VVFMVDDLGFGDVSFMQSDVEAAANLDTVAATPALNAMASKGIRLTSFYTSPTCTPSRASFMTGKYTTNLGLQVGRGGGFFDCSFEKYGWLESFLRAAAAALLSACFLRDNSTTRSARMLLHIFQLITLTSLLFCCASTPSVLLLV